MVPGSSPVDTGRKLNVYETFRRGPGGLLNALCPFNLRSASTGSYVPCAYSPVITFAA